MVHAHIGMCGKQPAGGRRKRGTRFGSEAAAGNPVRMVRTGVASERGRSIKRLHTDRRVGT
jgi:hypothetical protein